MSNSRTSVSLKDFIQTGEFGPIKLDMTRDEVITILGEPDDFSVNSNSKRRRRLKPAIIKYGDIEFYFTDETDQLKMIYSDHVSEFRGGSRISLDSWIIRGSAPRKEIEKTLGEIGVNFVDVKPWDPTTSQIRLDSGVELVFNEEEYNPLGLYSFCLKDDDTDG